MRAPGLTADERATLGEARGDGARGEQRAGPGTADGGVPAQRVPVVHERSGEVGAELRPESRRVGEQRDTQWQGSLAGRHGGYSA